jgi:hypothetical protein
LVGSDIDCAGYIVGIYHSGGRFTGCGAVHLYALLGANIRREADKMSLAKELWDFLKIRKKFWLAPIMTVLVILSAFIILATTSPVWAPLIYPIL